MSINIGQRYTRASDKTQQEQNVTVSVGKVRVDKEGQILEVPVLKGAAGQRQYFKEITGLVRDLLEGTPKGLSSRLPYAILSAYPFSATEDHIWLLNPTDLDALQLEEGDFLVVIKDFTVDPRVDPTSGGGYRHFFVHEITAQPPPNPWWAKVQIPVTGASPSFALNDANFDLGSIVINLSKIKPDSCLGDEGQLGLKTQLEQPSVPSFSDVTGGISEVIVTIAASEDAGVDAFDVWVRSEKPTALTPDMIPDLSLTVEEAASPQVVPTYDGGPDAGGDSLAAAPGDYWVTLTAKTLNAPAEGAITSYMNKYKWTPSDPAEPVLVTVS